MYAGRHYPFVEVLYWTRRDILQHLVVASIATMAHVLLGWKWLAIPWLPIALLGTAVAFIIGFKNNASYGRVWEARGIWGGIVNTSRTWGLMARDYLSDQHALDSCTPEQLDAARRTLYLRHFAWLTALRYQLREHRDWEAIHLAHNVEFKRRWFTVDEHENQLGPVLATYLSPAEYEQVMRGKNKPTQILALQSRHLEQLLRAGWIDNFCRLELEKILSDLLSLQGASERIKNFPYPRQYATMNLWFVQIFVLLMPFGMLQEFEELGGLVPVER